MRQDIRIEDIAEALTGHLAYHRSLEKKLEKMTRERDYWREKAEPGWDKRERLAALDGEIRLMRQ